MRIEGSQHGLDAVVGWRFEACADKCWLNFSRMFKKNLRISWFFFLLVVGGPSVHASEPVYHQLKINFEPSTSMIQVRDKIFLKTANAHCGSRSFYLRAGMSVEEKEISKNWMLSIETPTAENSYLQKLVLRKIPGEKCPESIVVNLGYSGFIAQPAESIENSKRSEGFILSGSDFFYPVEINSKRRVAFDMEVSLPESWESVSQGKREKLKAENGREVVRWNSEFPSEDIFLIGNRYKVYEEKYGEIFLYAFLLQDEAGLANKYIQTAKYYVDFYGKLFGPYPYSKFALVENMKQTGYGMPSFTLMGSRIIRFPFILHSSYPHEILHNWWGNGVFADSGSGNWSEGLTAYMADHLLMEIKGKGSQYRFQEMLKYLSYVNDTNEFPIKEFSCRDSMASQAIGYSKLLMVFHMLRTELGDKVFLKSLKKYFKSFRRRYAGFREMQKTFETISGKNLDWFFKQWVERKGSPKFELSEASYLPNPGRYDLFLEIKQSEPAYRLKLPLAIWTEDNGFPEIRYLNLDQTRKKFHLNINKKPQAVRLDPYNEVFRRLSMNEVPASIGQAFGATEAAIVLPDKETEELLRGYIKFADILTENGNIRGSALKKPDDDLPSKTSLWILGKSNKAGEGLLPELKKQGINFKDNGFYLKEGRFSLENHSFVFTLPRPKVGKGSMTWIIASSEESIPGLTRKLPHYGKYGYLVFKGKEPENVVKGSWRSSSPSLEKKFIDGNFSLPLQSPLVNFQPSNLN